MIARSRTQRPMTALAALFTMLGSIVAAAWAAPADAADRRPGFQLPFTCGQQWQIDSYDSSHAPALDMVLDPDSRRGETEGQPVLAPAAGTVTQSFYHSNAGNMIQIDHGGDWFTTYIHLQRRMVSEGDRVAQGQQDWSGRQDRADIQQHATPTLRAGH